MHMLAVAEMIKSVRRREAQGDCPTEPPFTREQLENALVSLADAFERVAPGRLQGMPSDAWLRRGIERDADVDTEAGVPVAPEPPAPTDEQSDLQLAESQWLGGYDAAKRGEPRDYFWPVRPKTEPPAQAWVPKPGMRVRVTGVAGPELNTFGWVRCTDYEGEPRAKVQFQDGDTHWYLFTSLEPAPDAAPLTTGESK